VSIKTLVRKIFNLSSFQNFSKKLFCQKSKNDLNLKGKSFKRPTILLVEGLFKLFLKSFSWKNTFFLYAQICIFIRKKIYKIISRENISFIKNLICQFRSQLSIPKLESNIKNIIIFFLQKVFFCDIKLGS